MDMFQVILQIAAFQALFFSMLLITKKSKNLSDKFLFAWLIALASQILFICRSMSASEEMSPTFAYLAFCLSMSHGIFLYLYAKSMTRMHITFHAKKLLNFVLCGCCIVFGLAFNHVETATLIVRSLSLISTLVYIVLTLHTIHKHQLFLAGHFSSTDRLNLEWLKFLLYGILFFCAGALTFIVTAPLFHVHIPLNEIFAVLILAFICIIGFKGLKQSTIFNEKILPAVEMETRNAVLSGNTSKNKAYVGYGLKEDEAIKLSERLKTYMERDRIYTNPELSLKDLAAAMETYPHYISQILNTIIHQNFYDFVNTYRVEEAKRQLLEEGNKCLTILAIALDCGFNSKSSFNRVFKQKTGKTPGEFIKSSN